MKPSRLYKLAGLRQAIAGETYEIPDRIAATVARLRRELADEQDEHGVRGGQDRDCRDVIGYAWILLVCVLIGGLLCAGLLVLAWRTMP